MPTLTLSFQGVGPGKLAWEHTASISAFAAADREALLDAVEVIVLKQVRKRKALSSKEFDMVLDATNTGQLVVGMMRPVGHFSWTVAA